MRDAYGNPVSGIDVAWTAVAGGGAVTPVTGGFGGQAVSRTDPSGRAQMVWTLGTTVGENIAQATVIGLSSAAFTASAIPGHAAQITLSPDSVRLESVGDTMRFQARAVDPHGNVIGASALTWSSTGPAAAVDGGRITAAARGLARIVVSAPNGDTAYETTNRQTDFVWAIPFRAKPAKTK